MKSNLTNKVRAKPVKRKFIANIYGRIISERIKMTKGFYEFKVYNELSIEKEGEIHIFGIDRITEVGKIIFNGLISPSFKVDIEDGEYIELDFKFDNPKNDDLPYVTMEKMHEN